MTNIMILHSLYRASITYLKASTIRDSRLWARTKQRPSFGLHSAGRKHAEAYAAPRFSQQQLKEGHGGCSKYLVAVTEPTTQQGDVHQITQTFLNYVNLLYVPSQQPSITSPCCIQDMTLASYGLFCGFLCKALKPHKHNHYGIRKIKGVWLTRYMLIAHWPDLFTNSHCCVGGIPWVRRAPTCLEQCFFLGTWGLRLVL